MSKKIAFLLFVPLFALGVMGVTMYFASQIDLVQGSAPSGLPSRVASSTTLVVGPDGTQDNGQTNNPGTTRLFEDVRSCTSRVVSTVGASAIMLSFGSTTGAQDFGTTTVSGVLGHWQAASTTVAYDSGVYGCGEWTAYGYASTTITVTEFK